MASLPSDSDIQTDAPEIPHNQTTARVKISEDKPVLMIETRQSEAERDADQVLLASLLNFLAERFGLPTEAAVKTLASFNALSSKPPVPLLGLDLKLPEAWLDNPNQVDSDYGNGEYSILAEAIIKNDKITFEALLQHPEIDVNYGEGTTPLQEACSHGRLTMVKQLLARSELDVNAESDSGDPPFLLACYEGRWNIARELAKDERLRPDELDFYSLGSEGRTILEKAGWQL